MMLFGEVLFRFVKQAVAIARKLTGAAVMQISRPAGNGIAGWKHAVMHFLRVHMERILLAEPRNGASASRACTPTRRVS